MKMVTLNKFKAFAISLLTLAITLGGLNFNVANAVSDGPINCSGGGTFTVENNIVTSKSGCVGTAIIPSGVTEISAYAFSWQSTITRIEIPASVTTIGRDITYNASGLTDIVVDSGNANYASISGVLFNKSATNLIVYPIGKTATTYNIPSSVTTLSDYSFAYTKLTSFTIPVSVTSIGYGVIYGSTAVTAVTFTAGSTITTISNSAFTSASALTSINIPGSVTSIEDWVFYQNPALTTVNFESGVAPLTIGEYAFNTTGLTSIDIPARVTSIGNDAFLNTSSLTSFNVHADNANYASADGVLFNKNLTTLKKYPRRKTSTSYTIPSTVTSLDRFAFHWSNILTSVNIPSSLTSMGWGAFYDTSALTNITVDPANLNFSSVDGVMFNKDLSTVLKFPEKKNSTSYEIPSTVTTIESYAFHKSNYLTSVTIPSTVTSIGDNAFNYATSLVDFYFLGNAPTLGSSVFSGVGASPQAYKNSIATGFGSISSNWNGLTVQLAPSTIPSAPTSLTATSGNGEAVISFTQGSDGGSAITNYKYSINGTTYIALSPSITTSPITISGLTNGTTYSIYLKAVNANGDSSASSAVSVTPIAPTIESDESRPDGYFEPIKEVRLSNQKISWEPNQKVVISRYDSNTKTNILIENTSGQFVFPKAKPGQSVSYSVMATDGTVLKVVTMKSKPLVPKIANAFAQKSAVLTINKKMAINARWIKDRSHMKYVVKIKLDNGKSIIARTTDPNFSIITDETKGATITITAIGKNNLTATVTRKI
jgi:hypothetical protein